MCLGLRTTRGNLGTELKSTLRARWQRIFSLACLASSMRLRTSWGRLLCQLHKHDWEPAPALDRKGEFDASRPGRYFRCRRPDCRILRGPLKLGVWGNWVQTDDFLVLVASNCNRCHGLGYAGKMRLPDGVLARVPCHCLRIQPAFIEVPAEGPARRKLRHEVEQVQVAVGQ